MTTNSFAADAPKSEPFKLAIPSGDNIVAHTRLEHPRLLMTAKDFDALKERIKADQQLQAWVAQLRKNAERVLTEPPSKYEIPDGVRLLTTSRRVVDRVYLLGLLYRLDSDKRYANRIWAEVEAAAAFPDWNPKHFLDTAEMTHGLAIAYDWLYDVWTEKQRNILRAAMVEKGLKPALPIYKEKRWWAVGKSNWNQVCNGGIGMGALALAEVERKLAAEILEFALNSLPLAMKQYAPDGACEEGPSYWGYATSYNVVFLAALKSALGTDFGLSQIPGFSEAGTFPVYITSPIGRTFNFADSGDGVIRAPEMFWLAKTFNRPLYSWYQKPLATGTPLDILWYDTSGEKFDIKGLPLHRYFRDVEVVTMRSSWTDLNALFVGFKAGSNKASHGHLDLGTFVFDALGKRWAMDLGADNYNLPGFWDTRRQRWTYYRLRAEGHNTLVINPTKDADQDPSAAAKILRTKSDAKNAYAIADLTAPYAKYASKVQRGIALPAYKQLIVQDEIQTHVPTTVWWFMHTAAKIKLSENEKTAILTQGNARLWAQIISPANVTFMVMKAQPLISSPKPLGQADNAAVNKLAIRVDEVSNERITVWFVPLAEGQDSPGAAPKPAPLEKW